MKTKNTKKYGIIKITLLISIAIASTTMFALNAMAQEIVPVGASRASEGCIWSEGIGSELYVPAGETCEITGSVVAVDQTSEYTDYAVIVYPGGTLQIGNDSLMASTTFEAQGKVLNMGTVIVGEGIAATAYSNTFTTANTGNGGDLIIGYNTGATFTVNNNAGTGLNKFSIDGTVDVGNSSIFNTPILNLHSDSIDYSADRINVWGHMNMTAGIMTVGSVFVADTLSGSSELNIESSATMNINSYYVDVDKIALGIGTQGSTGSAVVTVDGTLSIPNYPADDVNVIVGGLPATSATLEVGLTGYVNIDETNTWTTPATLEDPKNMLYVGGEQFGYGLLVYGQLDTDMVIVNSGIVTVDSSTAGTALLNANFHYKQESPSTDNAVTAIAADDTINITGTADFDGYANIEGNLVISDCTKIANDAVESFDIAATGAFTTGDSTCILSGTQPDDALNVQGSGTLVNIYNGADIENVADGTEGIYGQFTIDDGANVDANGYFQVYGDDLVVYGGASVYLHDGDGGSQDFTSDNLLIEPGATGTSLLQVEADTDYRINNGGNVTIGQTSPGGAAQMLVTGYAYTDDLAPSEIKIGSSGDLTVQSTGYFEAAGTSAGTFNVNGGNLTSDGQVIINYQLLKFDSGTINVGATGLIDSSATFVTPTDPAFDYNGGDLTIDYGGEAKFNDLVDIDGTGAMVVSGLLEGTDEIDYNGINTNNMIDDSGEMRVIGVGTPIIDIHQDLELYGKLNGDNGAGNITIFGATSPVVGGPGGAGNEAYTYILANTFEIESGASVDVSGFYESYDPGGAETYGGSFGGEGLSPAGPTTSTYGNPKYFTAPNYATTTENPTGMYGFNSAGAIVASGGGGIYIEAQGNMIIDGTISSNGDCPLLDNAGCGSGGQIVINHNIDHTDTAAEFKGSGIIEANGGDAGAGTNRYGGGGGRIVISSILFEDPDDDNGITLPSYQFGGTVRARGGSSNGGTPYAAAGTIVYLADDNNPNGTLIVDQETTTRPLGVGGAITKIQNTGDFVFDRVEARKGAIIDYVAIPGTLPTSCFENDISSAVSGITCLVTPDKPDTLFVNNSVTGAQGGDEPWVGIPLLSISDLDPSFSIYYRNPEDGTSVDKLRMQLTSNIADFNNAANYRTCATCLYDGDITLNTALTPGNQTVDFEYPGTPLTPGTTYYVRVAFYDNGGTNLGLWTHRDMDNHYKFEIASAYLNIENGCSDTITIENGGSPINIGAGQHFGQGSCTFVIDTSTITNWEVQFGKSPNPAGADLTGAVHAQNIAEIANSTDSSIDTTGNSNEEEYGFYIAPGLNLSTSNVMTESQDGVTQKFDSWDDSTPSDAFYLFDIEDNGLEDSILQDIGSAVSNGYFDLNVLLNISDQTYADNYLLETWMILTNGP